MTERDEGPIEEVQHLVQRSHPVRPLDCSSMGDGIPALFLELLLNFSQGGYCRNLSFPTSGLQKRRAKHFPLRVYDYLLILT